MDPAAGVRQPAGARRGPPAVRGRVRRRAGARPHRSAGGPAGGLRAWSSTALANGCCQPLPGIRVDQPVADLPNAGVVHHRDAQRLQVGSPDGAPASSPARPARAAAFARASSSRSRGPSGGRSPAAEGGRVGIQHHRPGGHRVAAGIPQHQSVTRLDRQRVMQGQPGHVRRPAAGPAPAPPRCPDGRRARWAGRTSRPRTRSNVTSRIAVVRQAVGREQRVAAADLVDLDVAQVDRDPGHRPDLLAGPRPGSAGRAPGPAGPRAATRRRR